MRRTSFRVGSRLFRTNSIKRTLQRENKTVPVVIDAPIESIDRIDRRSKWPRKTQQVRTAIFMLKIIIKKKLSLTATIERLNANTNNKY